jgi:predicted acylesterase/phospholipase RssA
VSGGTLLGAFLCKDNPGGLTRYIGRGLSFAIGISAGTWNSTCFERVVDWELDGQRVEELDTRLVAITTQLRDGASPYPHAVVKGTLGEAVRVSGAAPGLFGPADKHDVRYIDGSTALAVPARILPDYGADTVFAFNAIGPVREPNLLRAFGWTRVGRAMADVLYHHPLVGRSVDQMVGQYTLLQQASRADVEDTDVFYEAPPEAIPILDGFQWLHLRRIVAEAVADEATWKPVSERCIQRWKEFRKMQPLSEVV